MKKLFLAITMAFLVMACDKDPLPVVLKDVKLEVAVEQVTKVTAQVFVKTEANSRKILSQGVCYSVSTNPGPSDLKVTGGGNLNLLNLVPSTKYYVKAYAVTEEKTFYSKEVNFETQGLNVTLTVSDVEKRSAVANISVDEDLTSITSSGVCYSLETNPTTYNQKVEGMGTLSLSNLELSTSYYARAYVQIGDKTFYSQEKEFETQGLNISLVVADVEKRSAVASISVDDDLTSITSSGVYYSNNNVVPTASDKKLEGIEGLQLNLLSYETTYFVRAYVLIGNKTYYSDVTSFTTTKLPTVKDYDGNTYRVIEMQSTKGTQLWLLDNFKGTHFANGDTIPEVRDNEAWTKQTGPAYCHYNNDPKNTEVSGALYNWYVGSDPRGLIIGWRPPTDKEWFEIVTCLPGQGFTKAYMFKEEGTSHWRAPNAEATNETGFTVIPGGIRNSDEGKFYFLQELAIFVSYDNFGIYYWARMYYHDKNLIDAPGMSVSTGNSIRMRKVD